ncbi:MAG: ATP-binding cassette domain-containing protein, partial [Hyphomicrobium sp.]
MKRPLSVNIASKVFRAVGDRPDNLVLKNMAFQVEPGSFVIITEPSGGGKSTLLNIIAGLDHDYSGSVDFGGDHDPRIAFVFQSPRLLPWRTVYENIAL